MDIELAKPGNQQSADHRQRLLAGVLEVLLCQLLG